MNKEVVTREMSDVPYEPDSMEIGTPSKGGSMKVYGNANKPEEFRAKIDAMIQLRLYLQQQIDNPPVKKETVVETVEAVKEF